MITNLHVKPLHIKITVEISKNAGNHPKEQKSKICCKAMFCWGAMWSDSLQILDSFQWNYQTPLAEKCVFTEEKDKNINREFTEDNLPRTQWREEYTGLKRAYNYSHKAVWIQNFSSNKIYYTIWISILGLMRRKHDVLWFCMVSSWCYNRNMLRSG